MEDFDRSKYRNFVLAVDVGGMHTYLAALGVVDSKTFHILRKTTHTTASMPDIIKLINEMLEQAKNEFGIAITLACLGAAGPVPHNREFVKLTNVDLHIAESRILTETPLKRIMIINDFEAAGYGIDILDLGKDAELLPHVGDDFSIGHDRSGTIAVIGAGSGLGMSIGPFDRKKHLHAPLACEGGHIDLVPHNQLELELAQFLTTEKLTRKVHPELERVLSGPGIENVFEFFHRRKDTELSRMILGMKGDEKLRAIEAGYGKDEVCSETLDMVFSFYARACRYLALMSSCYSGLFIMGNIALNNMDLLRDKRFMEQFSQHDKRSDVLRRVPVYVIKNPDLALYGCCNVAVNYYYI